MQDKIEDKKTCTVMTVWRYKTKKDKKKTEHHLPFYIPSEIGYFQTWTKVRQ